MRLYKTQYSFRISGNRGYDSNRVRFYPFGMQYVLNALNSHTTDRLPRVLCVSLSTAVKCTALLLWYEIDVNTQFSE